MAVFNLDIVDVADMVDEVEMEEDDDDVTEEATKKGRGADKVLDEFARFEGPDMKSVKLQDNFILNAANLRDYCEKNSVPPVDENQFFVPYYYISGETTAGLEITVIWTTLNLITRISMKMLQDDATYKLNWLVVILFTILVMHIIIIHHLQWVNL